MLFLVVAFIVCVAMTTRSADCTICLVVLWDTIAIVVVARLHNNVSMHAPHMPPLLQLVANMLYGCYGCV